MRNLAQMAVVAALACAPAAPGLARDDPAHRKATPFLPIANEAPAALHVDPPLAGPLADRGVVIVRYRTENFRILPIFGKDAVPVSPRAGHLHVSVDGLPWRWADAGGTDAVVVVGLEPGPHSILIELATPVHGVLTGRAVSFTVPPRRAH